MKVSGPASVVNQIDTVVATINVDGMSTDITDRVTPVFMMHRERLWIRQSLR